VVMKASRSEAARAAVRADESNAAGATGRDRRRRDPRKLSKRGRARCGTHRTGLILAVLRRRGALGGGDRVSLVGSKEEGSCLRYLAAPLFNRMDGEVI